MHRIQCMVIQAVSVRFLRIGGSKRRPRRIILMFHVERFRFLPCSVISFKISRHL